MEIAAGQVDTAGGLRARGVVLTDCGTRDLTAHGFLTVRDLTTVRAGQQGCSGGLWQVPRVAARDGGFPPGRSTRTMRGHGQ
ncbi:hypothetical protein GCM10023108_09680 [Saccharopolyspora hordei]